MNCGCVVVVVIGFLFATHTNFLPNDLQVCVCFLTIRIVPSFLQAELVACALGAFGASCVETSVVSDIAGTTESTTDAPAVAIWHRMHTG